MDPRVQVIRDVGLAVGSATPSLDGFHRPVSFGDVVTGIWSINYDAEDRLTRLQSPTGDVTEIHYDAVGNTSDIMEPGGRISHFEYEERDALVQAQWPSGDVSRYEYDERGDLSRAKLDLSNGGGVNVAEYAHDGLHRIRRFVEYTDCPSTDAEVTEFGYSDTGDCSAYRSLQSRP
jgi:YD repeat-containing protein